jgi:uncharacterized phiE125 gp8 family phage protein
MSSLLKSTIDKAWPYTVTVAPVNKPLTLLEVKTHLRIDTSDASEDTYLNLLIDAVTEYAEKYTKRDFITRTYKTLRDCFWDSLEIRRNPIQSVSIVKYLVDDVLTLVSTDVYFLIESNTFPHLSLKVNQVWPTNEDDREQAVEIIFVSGYGDDPTDIPEKLKLGMLNHIADMYENRGDCDESSGISGMTERLLPKESKLIYDMCKIRNI